MNRAKLNAVLNEVDVSDHTPYDLSHAVEKLKDVASPKGTRKPTSAETANYIADMLKEMSEIASNSNLVFLAYLLDVAHEEAKIQGRRA